MNAIDSALARRLDLVSELTQEDRKALHDLPFFRRTVEAGVDIVVQGEPINHCCLLVDGFIHRYCDTREGKRQIIAFHVTGDVPDLHSLNFHVLDHSVAATVKCELAFIPHADLWDLCMARPNIAAALWREILIDSSIFRQWIVALGRMSGIQRTAHLLCELTMRMRAMGFGDSSRYHLPLTQNELADALGLSFVSVNRTLQSLKQKGLIDRNRSWLTIKDWSGLAEIASFDARYLHFRSPPSMSSLEESEIDALASVQAAQ